MQTVTLILANILLLLIVAAGVCIERRVVRLEVRRSKEAARVRELRREVEELRRCFEEAEEPVTETEERRVRDAERRFTEGVASILGYGLRANGKETEYDENAGA